MNKNKTEWKSRKDGEITIKKEENWIEEKRVEKKKKKKKLTIGKRQNIRTAVVKHGYRYILIKRETCG